MDERTINKLLDSIHEQTVHIKTIKNCVVFFTVFMIISIVVSALAFLWAL